MSLFVSINNALIGLAYYNYNYYSDKNKPEETFDFAGYGENGQ